ncbi:CIC11C00000002806 [Sungouiella intermedia]|uniref:CIC11C00000002806 n=1 Tax=Sungouiella intermedia TaxID=45354 RepID=A0A1L0BLM1_9ASCO|nr:CIC11C00000002806 [[Candida] intermedia]
MSIKPYELSLEELDELEGTEITLPYFNTSVAWEIGLLARQLAQEFNKPIVIDITLSSGQVVFHSPSKPGSGLDNDFWINRKKKTVLRFAKSSFFMGRKLAFKEKSAGVPLTLEATFFVDSSEYATHGGSVPIKADNFDGIYGAFTVSGLAQEEDHLFALKVLREIKAKLK